MPCIKGRIKVMNVAETIKGGVATYLNQLAGISEIETSYLVPDSQKDQLVELDNVQLFPGESRASRLASLIKKLKTVVNSGQYDIIFLHSTFSGYAYFVATLLSRKKTKIIYCAHGWSFLRKKTKAELLICKLADYIICNKVDAVIHISQHDFDNSRFIRPRMEKIILNSLPDDVYDELHINTRHEKMQDPYKKLTLLFVGRLDEQKGFDLLYEAMRRLKGRGFELLVVGDSVLKGHRYVETDNVKFLGWLERGQVKEMYQRADITIMPSRWEGFGYVAIESMAQGTPVLASKAGALPEVIGNHGIVRNLSTPCLIKQEIEGLKSSYISEKFKPEELRSFVKKNYSKSRFCQEIKNLYKEVM